MIITADTRTHLDTDAARCEVEAWIASDLQQISDAAALTIASWFQSPRGYGATFAQLSTTGSVESDDLYNATEWERGMVTLGTDDESLCALGEWAKRKGQGRLKWRATDTSAPRSPGS